MARGEGIKRITDLFEGYKGRFIAPKRTVVDAFREVVQDLFQFEIRPAQISYTPGTKMLMLNAPGPLKTEILLRKAEILAHLKGRLGEKNAPHDII